MYETATAAGISALSVEMQFVDVTLPEDWDGRRTVLIWDEEGAEAQVTVHPTVMWALKRAAILTPLGLCSRIDLVVTVEEPRVVGVSWEG